MELPLFAVKGKSFLHERVLAGRRGTEPLGPAGATEQKREGRRKARYGEGLKQMREMRSWKDSSPERSWISMRR